jgi:hypothetical protein
MIKILHNLAFLSQKRLFAKFFGENIVKIITSVPEDVHANSFCNFRFCILVSMITYKYIMQLP